MLCYWGAVDLLERAKGAVKSSSGLRVYRELGQGPRGAREITCGEFIEPFSPARPVRSSRAAVLRTRDGVASATSNGASCSRKKLPAWEFFATKQYIGLITFDPFAIIKLL